MTVEGSRHQIARELRTKIRRGTLKPGAKLPSGAELAAMYGVSPRTAQLAIKDLRDEELVHGRRGRGVYVGPGTPSRAPKEARTLADRVRTLEREVGWLKAALHALGIPPWTEQSGNDEGPATDR